MIYENKIDWRATGGGALSAIQSQFKSAVLDYQIALEGELEDIIRRHFLDAEVYDVKYAPFTIQVALARALIGKTPDDEIWKIIKGLSEIRNQYSHSRFTETAAGKKKIEDATTKIFGQLRGVNPEIFPNGFPALEIITQAHFMVQVFFRKINEALDSRGLPRWTPG